MIFWIRRTLYERFESNQIGFWHCSFYKSGCPYCQAGKQAVISAAEKSAYPTFYINVESEKGQVLVKKYQVKKAATIVTLRDGKQQLSLYATKDSKGKIKADESAIKEAMK